MKLLGSSWATSLLGYAVAGIIAGYQVYEATTAGQPVNWMAIAFAVYAAIQGRITKQVNVSNAPNPLPEAVPVPPPK